MLTTNTTFKNVCHRFLKKKCMFMYMKIMTNILCEMKVRTGHRQLWYRVSNQLKSGLL